MMLINMMVAPAPAFLSVETSDGSPRVMKEKPKADMSRPRIMKGSEYSRIRRRPMRSMSVRATSVKMKFVTATVSEVSVGLWKPTRVKIVAEKYIREFCSAVSVSQTSEGERTTYEAAKLLQSLKKTSDSQRATVLPLFEQLLPRAEPSSTPGALIFS